MLQKFLSEKCHQLSYLKYLAAFWVLTIGLIPVFKILSNSFALALLVNVAICSFASKLCLGLRVFEIDNRAKMGPGAYLVGATSIIVACLLCSFLVQNVINQEELYWVRVSLAALWAFTGITILLLDVRVRRPVLPLGFNYYTVILVIVLIAGFAYGQEKSQISILALLAWYPLFTAIWWLLAKKFGD